MNIILTHLPPKPGKSASLYAGRPIVTAELIDAFTKYAPQNRIIVYTPPGRCDEYKRYTNDYLYPEKLELMDAKAIELSIGSHEKSVILTFTTSLRYGFHLRWLCGSQPWPVIGLTHDLSSHEVFDELLLAHIKPPAPYDAIVCISQSAHVVVEHLIDKVSTTIGHKSSLKLPVIPHGIDLSSFELGDKKNAIKCFDLSDSGSIILYLGRISDTMKADLIPLLTAFSRVLHDPKPMLVIAGGVSCPREEKCVTRIKDYITKLKLTDNVRIATNITYQQRSDLLASADVFVSPADSLQESFGLVLLEAMAAKLPIVASDWNGYRDIVKDSETGFLIETTMPSEGLKNISDEMLFEDRFCSYGGFSQSVVINIDQLTNAISTLINDSTLAKKMGIAGRDRAEKHYQWQYIVSIYQREWERLTAIAKASDYMIPASPYSYIHSDAFKLHPTNTFDSNMVIRKTLQNTTPSFLEENPPSFLSKKILSDILISINNPTKISDIDLPASKSNRHVAYLLKQGLAEIVNE